MEKNNMTIAELTTAYTAGTKSVANVMDATLASITALDTDIKAYLDVFEEDARTTAKRLAAIEDPAERSALPLYGVPLAIKNNILIAGKRATGSSKILENYTATYDATIITKLKAAGAVLVGSTNMDEFAMGSATENSAFGPTKNPHDTERVPGGSSGGSAAAVAMGSVPAAIGTDTGGSIRQPASYCGLVGFKPTYGAVSRYGLMAMGSSFDQAGPLTNSVADAQLLHRVMAGKDPMDATTISEDTYPTIDPKERYRIGVPRDFLAEGIDPDVRQKFDAHLALLSAAGHEVVDISLPLFKAGLAAYYISMPAEVSSNLARYDGMRYGVRIAGDDLLDEYLNSRGQGFGPEVKRRILLGTYVLSSGYYDAYYGKAEALRDMMRAELHKEFASVDMVVTPTAPTPAFKSGEHADPVSVYAQDIFTVPVNLTGVPAISIPMGTVDRDGKALPVGVQYIAPHAGEARLFDLGIKMHDSQ